MDPAPPRNLLDPLPPVTAGKAELFEELASGGGVRIERIVSRGHASPEGFWYDQPDDEWVMVVRGRAAIELAAPESPDRIVELGPGDFMILPAGCRHRVRWTARDEPTVWLAVHYPSHRARG